MSTIRFIRQLRGYSQEYVAKKLSISQNTFSRYEANPSKLSDNILTSIAALLGVTKESFLQEELFIKSVQNVCSKTSDTLINDQKECEIDYTKILQFKQQEIDSLRAQNSNLENIIEGLSKQLKKSK